MVIVDDDRKSLLVIVPDDQLSLAIGRQGQNVRLAARLLGWKIDVKSEQRYSNLENKGYLALTAVDGVDESLADRLFAAGITSAAVLAAMDIEQLMSLARVDQEKARSMQQMAATIKPPGTKAGYPDAPQDDPEEDELEDQGDDEPGNAVESGEEAPVDEPFSEETDEGNEQG
jgi:N utilization substance protein A